MSRPFFLLFTAVFLGAQVLFFAHASGYALEKHKHKETACEICLSAKYQDCSSPGVTSEVCFFHHAEYIPQPSIGVIIIRNTCDTGITRGPPLSS